MEIVSDRILDAAIAALQRDSVTIDGVVYSRPANLLVEDHTAVSIEPETLPYGSVRPLKEKMSHDSGDLSTSTDRTFRFVVALWAEDTFPRKALSPLIGWCTKAIQFDPTLGGICDGVFEEDATWSDDFTDQNRGLVEITLRAEYTTSRNNQETKL